MLFERLLVTFTDELAANLVADVAGEHLLDELLWGVAGAKAGDRRLLAEVLELLGKLCRDAFLRDLHGHLLRARTGVLHLHGVRERFLLLLFLLGDGAGLIFGLDHTSIDKTISGQS